MFLSAGLRAADAPRLGFAKCLIGLAFEAFNASRFATGLRAAGAALRAGFLTGLRAGLLKMGASPEGG